MVSHGSKTLIALLAIRSALVLAFLLLCALFLSWDEATPWWPVATIATNGVCLVILIVLLRREGTPFWSIQRAPFASPLPLGKVTQLLNDRPTESRLVNSAADVLRFAILLLCLGFPAIAFNEFLSQTIPALAQVDTVAPLPIWALVLMLILLPVTQALVEFPWFYGYIYPRLEARLESHGSRRIVASTTALAIVVAGCVLQAVVSPLILSPAYVLWRVIAFVPLFLVIGIVIRLVPRFMPGVNVLHAAMALAVVLEFWSAR